MADHKFLFTFESQSVFKLNVLRYKQWWQSLWVEIPKISEPDFKTLREFASEHYSYPSPNAFELEVRRKIPEGSRHAATG